MSIMDTFNKVASVEMFESYDIRAYFNDNYVRQDGEVTVFVVDRHTGYECFFSDDVRCRSVVDSMEDTPEAALINALTWRLAPVAVMDEWTKPKLCGLKYCCEDVVNKLAYDVAKAAADGLTAVVYDHEYHYDNLVDRCMGVAIEHMRKHARCHGIDFVDVWDETKVRTYTMLSFETHDSENPDFIHFIGTEEEAIERAKNEGVFEVDIYEGNRIHPDTRSVCAVMHDGTVLTV